MPKNKPDPAKDPKLRKRWLMANTLREADPRTNGERRLAYRQAEFLKGLILGLVGGGIIGWLVGFSTQL